MVSRRRRPASASTFARRERARGKLRASTPLSANSAVKLFPVHQAPPSRRSFPPPTTLDLPIHDPTNAIPPNRRRPRRPLAPPLPPPPPHAFHLGRDPPPNPPLRPSPPLPPSPLTVRAQLPFNLVVALGSYCLWELGMGVLTFGECEGAYEELMGVRLVLAFVRRELMRACRRSRWRGMT